MIYIYDLVLNWNDKRRYEFFEWNEDDEIEYVKKIPLFDELLDSNIRVDKNFLDQIFNKAEVYGNRQTERIEYAAVFCNRELNKAIAIEFSDEGESIYKSNIYFLDLEDIFNIGSRTAAFDLNYQILYDNNDEDYYLTRSEVMKKKYLISEINTCYLENNIDKLEYIYYEVFGEDSSDIQKIHDRLLKSLNNDFSDVHDNLYDLIKIPNF